jgi:hypothetical protein
MDRIDCAALLLAAGIVSFQIFVPPAIGLADNGDFVKITGRFDLYLPQGQANGFADTTYAIDPQHHWRGDHISSEILLAGIAVGLNRIFSSTTFDLRWIGAVHGALYLLAFYLALPLMRGLPLLRRVLLMGTIIVILGDVMFVSALNSFYMDTAAWIFLCLCAVLYLRALHWQTNANRVGLIVCLALLLTAKTQHVVAGCILFVLILVTWRQLGFDRQWLAWSAATAVAGIVLAYVGTPWGYATIQHFNIIFYGLLPHSGNVHRDLEELGLDDSYKRWIGMHTYSDGAPMLDLQFVQNFKERTGFGHLAAFYARHPEQPWRLLVEAMDEAGRERPYLGNYDRRTGVREFQESNSFSAWSRLKQTLFYHNGRLYLGYVLGLVALLSTLAWRKRRVLPRGVFAGAVAFTVLTVLELLICSIGDVLDTLRHEFVFNGVSDLAVVFVAALSAKVGK